MMPSTGLQASVLIPASSTPRGMPGNPPVFVDIVDLRGVEVLFFGDPGQDTDLLPADRPISSSTNLQDIRVVRTKSDFRTAVSLARGDYLFFGLPGGFTHPEEFIELLRYLKSHPDYNLTYGPKFGADADGGVWFQTVACDKKCNEAFLMDLPDSLSQIAISREIASQSKDDEIRFEGVDQRIALVLQLLLSGYSFTGIDKPFVYQKQVIDTSIGLSQIELSDLVGALSSFFADESCPQELKRNQDFVIGRVYCSWALRAFLRGQPQVGRTWLREAVVRDRSILDSQGRELLNSLVFTVLPLSDDVTALVDRFFGQLPEELEWLTLYRSRLIAYVYLMRAIAEYFWGSVERAVENIHTAGKYELVLDDYQLHALLSHIRAYGAGVEEQTLERTIIGLYEKLLVFGYRPQARWLHSTYFIGRAFDNFRRADAWSVLGDVMRAVRTKPNLLVNKGVLSISSQLLLDGVKTNLHSIMHKSTRQ